MHLILFSIVAMMCLAGALNLLLQRHPIHSALSLIAVMSSLAVLYLMLGAEFLALVQIIVYSGAIMVLFVFVIMLLNTGEEERTHGTRMAYVVGIPGVLALFTMLAAVFLSLSKTYGAVHLGEALMSTNALGRVLFRDFLLPFETTSVLILVAILGAVVMARKEH